MKEVVIIDAVRTPVGSLRNLTESPLWNSEP